MRLTKAILQTGTHHSPDTTLEITPKRLKHWESVFRKMQDAGLGVPIGWDHSDDPSKTVPVKFSTEKGKKRSAKDSVGWLEEFKIAEDGNSAELLLDIRDKAAADKAANNVVELSPIIYKQWKDGANTVWEDCITHADLVLHPVEHGQGPFKPADQPAIACSIRMGLDVGKPQVYRMATDDGDEKPKKDFGADDASAANDSASDDTPAENPDLPKDVGTDTAKQIEAVVAHLALLTDPVVLPSDTDESNFFDRLLTALMTAKAAKDAAAAKEADDEDDDDEDDMSNAKESQPQFAAMSLLTQKADAAHNFAEGIYRKDLTGRLDLILKSGRCTPAEHQAQKQALGVVRLSLGDGGAPVKSAAELWMESREGLPAGAAWKSEDRIRMAKEIPAPDFAKGEESEEEAEEIVDRMFGKKKQLAAT
jgi:hypothetical protein